MRGQYGGAQTREEIQLPAAQPVQYFVANRMRPELLDEEAEAWAKKLKGLSSSQLRRFYDHVTGLQRRLELEGHGGANEAAFENLRADFKMLKAKAAYAFKRPASKVPRDFLQFVVNHVSAVKNARDFEAFAKHFQAVVAFHKFYEEK